jgi:hypothetical protein
MNHSDKPTIPDVKPLVIAYLRRPHNCVGGSLHIYFDDGNWHRDHIEGCREYAIERGDKDGIELCNILIRMSDTQRIKIYRNCYRWADARGVATRN